MGCSQKVIENNRESASKQKKKNIYIYIWQDWDPWGRGAQTWSWRWSRERRWSRKTQKRKNRERKENIKNYKKLITAVENDRRKGRGLRGKKEGKKGREKGKTLWKKRRMERRDVTQLETTSQPDVANSIPTTLFYVNDMRFSKKESPNSISMWLSESQTNTCNIILEKSIPENYL